jgi:beta-lactamase regulating signal transducer with metallopeptidase domain
MILYLLKSALCLLVLLLVYRLLLQREAIYQFNRFYLLAAVIGSFIIPMIAIEVPLEPTFVPRKLVQEADFSANLQGISLERTEAEPIFQAVETQQTLDWSLILGIGYGLITLVFFIRFVRNIQVLLNKINRNVHVIYRGETVVLLHTTSLPFSFLSYIFVSKDYFENHQLTDAIFAHERAHVHGKHSWDNLLIEALLIPFWFHPGLYLAREAIKLNHEFIADEAALQVTPVDQYKTFLLAMMLPDQNSGLVSSLNFSLTKKRFEMMNKSSKSRIKILKLASLVGFLAIIVWVFAEKVTVNSIEQETEATGMAQTANKAKSFSLELFADGRMFLEKQLVSKNQLVDHLSKLSEEEIVVLFKADPALEAGQVTEIQEMLLAHDVRRVYMQELEFTGQEVSLEEKMERHFREAIFVIESTDMEYTQKRYAELSEKEKTKLLFTDKKVEKKTPDNQLFEQWKNEKEFALWIDGKSVANTVLAKFQAKDFDWYFQSVVKANARSARFPQPFQVHLYSPKYFEDSFGPNSDMFRPRTNRDTITITQRMLTSMKDLSRYPDPVTAYLQKNARYEKLKASPEDSSPEVRQEIQLLFEELESEYSRTPDNRKKRLKKPIPPIEANSGESVVALAQNKSTY